MDRLSENQPAATLDYVDDTHVLLTFNQKKLWQRLPECPPEQPHDVLTSHRFQGDRRAVLRIRNLDFHLLRIKMDGGGGGSRTRVRKCYWSRELHA